MRLAGGIWLDTGSVPVGTPAVVELATPGDVTVTARPGGAGAVTVEWTVSDYTDLRAGNAVWFASTITNAMAAANTLRNGPTTGVRITAVTSAASYELAQRDA